MLSLFGLTLVFIIFTYQTLTRILPWINKVWKCTKAVRPFCHEKPHWFWGHLRMFPGATEAAMMMLLGWTERSPRGFTVYFGPVRPSLLLTHPETVKAILKTAMPKNSSDGGGYQLLFPWIGDGLLLSKGDKWFRNRRLLTPAFHFDILKPYIDVYNLCTEKLLETFEERASRNQSIEIFHPVSLCTLDIILKCAFSYKGNVHDESHNSYIKDVLQLSTMVMERMFQPHLYNNTLYNMTQRGQQFRASCSTSHRKAEEVIQSRRKAFLDGENPTMGNRYTDFLDILLLATDQDGKGFTDAEIRDEVETFMFEGHDTTASGISWALYNLARHPDVQEKARNELLSVVGQKKQLTWDHLTQVPYFTMCIKESLRLHPPVVVISRELTEPLTVDGHALPKGVISVIVIWLIHHNSSVWGEDHMDYKPERFSPENMSKMDSHAFIPFSAGPRNCIGQNFALNEMKCTIAKVLMNFELREDKTHKVEMSPQVTMKAKNGIKLFFKKRAGTDQF